MDKQMKTTVYEFAEVVSTNLTAKDPQYGHGDLVLARFQTAGRGQRGNGWASAPGENLTFSLVLEPVFLAARHQFLLSETAALAVSDTLSGYGIASRIKWTNDVYVGDRKICGMLLENDLRAGNIARCIAGIGLDVNQLVFPGWIPNPTSMALETGRTFDLQEVLDAFRRAVAYRYELLRRGGREVIEKDYHRLLYRRDEPHPFRLPSGELFTGIIRGVEPSGELKVEHESGELQSYRFREIGFVIGDESCVMRLQNGL